MYARREGWGAMIRVCEGEHCGMDAHGDAEAGRGAVARILGGTP